MSHSSSRVKDQAVIARRKSDRKREQRRAGVSAIVAKIRGEYVKPAKIVNLRPVFRVGLTVLHKTKDNGDTGKLIRRVESGPDTGKWLVRWGKDKSNSGPYVERNLVIV